jgi:hypothetical protein
MIFVSNTCAQPGRPDTHQSLSRPCTDLVDNISAEQYIFVSTTESTVGDHTHTAFFQDRSMSAK